MLSHHATIAGAYRQSDAVRYEADSRSRRIARLPRFTKYRLHLEAADNTSIALIVYRHHNLHICLP